MFVSVITASRMKFRKTPLSHDLTCALCGVRCPESSHDARVDVGCKEVQKTETGEREHAKRAGSAEGGNKAPTTPAPKSRVEKRVAERDNKKQQARRNRNGPSKRGHVHYAAYERAMRAAHERKVARADWFGLRRAESRARKALVASVVKEAGGVTLSDVFEDHRARQAIRDEQALFFSPSGRDEPVLPSIGASDDRIGIEVAALITEDGMFLEQVRKLARECDADDDEAEKRAREKHAKVSGMNRKERRAAAQKEDKQAAVRAIVQARVEAKRRAVEAKKRAEAAVFEARVADRNGQGPRSGALRAEETAEGRRIQGEVGGVVA